MEIYWTDTAKETYLYILDFLSDKWGEKITTKFINQTEKSISLIAQFPTLYECIGGFSEVRKVVLHKNCSFLYRIANEKIELLVFWDTRQEPFI